MLLADEFPRRWRHVQVVSARALLFHRSCDPDRLRLLVNAGLVHDIGYASAIAETGFHPIDGARHLRHLGFPEDLVGLVAHHTCAAIEAELRDMSEILEREFPRNEALPHDELLYCDLTTGPNGDIVTVRHRLDEVKRRYGPDSIVNRFIVRAEPELLAASDRARAKLRPWHQGTSRDVFSPFWTSPDVRSGGCSVPVLA